MQKTKKIFGLYNLGFYTGACGLFSKLDEEFRRGYYDSNTQEYVIGDYTKNISRSRRAQMNLEPLKHYLKRFEIDFEVEQY